MPKKSILQRELKRKKLIVKYFLKRKSYLKKVKDLSSFNEMLNFSFKLQKLPKNSIQTRFKNRCWKTGKSRGFFRFFGLCRNVVRELANDCFLPGIIKSSW